MTGRSRKSEPAISRVLSRTIIHLGRPSPAASSNLPGNPLGTGGAGFNPRIPLFGLAPGGVYRAASCYQSRGALLPHLFTLTGHSPAVYFLWHFPWACALQALPGALSEGARTFLYSACTAAIAWPTPTFSDGGVYSIFMSVGARRRSDYRTSRCRALFSIRNIRSTGYSRSLSSSNRSYKEFRLSPVTFAAIFATSFDGK